MTPRSGWWNCAAERGGGIVCWLEIMQAVHSDGPMRDVYFVASSGHELVHQNFAIFPMEKTVEEIYALYRDALRFTGVFPTKVRDYIVSSSSSG